MDLKNNRHTALVATGTVSAQIMEDVAILLEEFLGLECSILPPMDPPPEAFNSLREQYHAGIVLDRLDAHHSHALRVLGIASYDLFLPVFTHVYGEAQVGGRAAVISLARIGPSASDAHVDHSRFVDRAIKVAVHELLHTFNLVHCRDANCVMRAVTRIPDLDALPRHLCRSCRGLWEVTRPALAQRSR